MQRDDLHSDRLPLRPVSVAADATLEQNSVNATAIAPSPESSGLPPRSCARAIDDRFTRGRMRSRNDAPAKDEPSATAAAGTIAPSPEQGSHILLRGFWPSWRPGQRTLNGGAGSSALAKTPGEYFAKTPLVQRFVFRISNEARSHDKTLLSNTDAPDKRIAVRIYPAGKPWTISLVEFGTELKRGTGAVSS